VYDWLPPLSANGIALPSTSGRPNFRFGSKSGTYKRILIKFGVKMLRLEPCQQVSGTAQSVLPTWRMLEVVRWDDDDALTYDLLRVTSLRRPSPRCHHSWCKVCSLFTTTERLDGFSWSLVWTLSHCSQLQTRAHGDTNVMDAQYRDVGWWCRYPPSSAHAWWRIGSDNDISLDKLIYR
jgi:hypothetical protein